MPDRFNFYDFYGYLLPGLALVTVFWIPFGMVVGWWPKGEVVAALALLGVSYFLGLLLQAVGERAIPSKTTDGVGNQRYPSDLQLDAEDRTLSPEAKHRIAARVQEQFGLDVGLNIAWDNELGQRRRSAFFQARNQLIERKLQAYPEQFQGLYSLMLGLTLAFGGGALYLFGWAAKPLMSESIVSIARIIFGVSLLALLVNSVFIAFFSKKGVAWDSSSLIAAGATLMSGGFLLGNLYGPTREQVATLSIIGLVSLFFCFRFYDRYRYFTSQFAKAVWDQFGTLR